MTPNLPDSVHVMTGDSVLRPAQGAAPGTWRSGGALVTAEQEAGGLRVRARAGRDGLARVALRWRRPVPPDSLVLGDAWERSYGDLQWRHLQPERELPWYWLATHNGATTGMGVRTRPRALCSWTLDEEGVTLWLDVRSGALPVLPGDRELDLATVVRVESAAGPFHAAGELCAVLSPDPVLPPGPVVGCNNWYYAYGQNFGPDAVLRDARTIAAYADGHPVRPYCVIDDGWTAHHGPWDRGHKGLFDDMAGLAAEIAAAGARPGLWFRPLMSGERRDPSLPSVLHEVAEDVARFRSWGYELIKHDYSSYDVFGGFGGPGPQGVPLADRSRTTAEIVLAFYETIAAAAGDALIIGCNAVGHLAAGLVQVQRTGDDTSGLHWERTRRMGVNTLAFRLPQHGRLFAVDADCVPCTPHTEWELNRRFLDLVARSATALFVSVDPAARTDRADADLSRAVRLALDGGQDGGIEPLDWLTTTAPRRWRAGADVLDYDWSQPWGASPFPV